MDLQEVRRRIDDIDGDLIRLLAERQRWVEEAGRLKPHNDAAAVAAPERVAQVIAARREMAAEVDLDADVAEVVWRAMIAAFIALEERVNRQ